MAIRQILLLCILGAALLAAVTCNNGSGPDDCCFKYYPRRLNKNLVTSYYPTDERCHKNAVVLITVKSRMICADPNMTWVEDIMRRLDQKSF